MDYTGLLIQFWKKPILSCIVYLLKSCLSSKTSMFISVGMKFLLTAGELIHALAHAHYFTMQLCRKFIDNYALYRYGSCLFLIILLGCHQSIFVENWFTFAYLCFTLNEICVYRGRCFSNVSFWIYITFHEVHPMYYVAETVFPELQQMISFFAYDLCRQSNPNLLNFMKRNNITDVKELLNLYERE